MKILDNATFVLLCNRHFVNLQNKNFLVFFLSNMKFTFKLTQYVCINLYLLKKEYLYTNKKMMGITSVSKEHSLHS